MSISIQQMLKHVTGSSQTTKARGQFWNFPDERIWIRFELKTTDLKSIGITTPVYINDSLCFYYKKLWSKCKKLWTNKFIFGYWVSNGSIKIRISERSPVKVISHIVDLEKLFPDNPLLKDDHIKSSFYRDIKSI